MLSKTVACLALVLAVATPVHAAGQTTSGSFLRISQSSGSFLFSNPENTYDASGAEITLDGASASFAQLQPGDTASLTLNDASTGLARIDAHTQPVQQFSGTLSSVSPHQGTISVPAGGGSIRIFWVDPAATQISRNGATASLGELQSGDRIEMSYRTSTALSISASG